MRCSVFFYSGFICCFVQYFVSVNVLFFKRGNKKAYGTAEAPILTNYPTLVYGIFFVTAFITSAVIAVFATPKQAS